MKTKIQKWGNSLGVRLPKNITEQKSLRAGLGVSIVLKDNHIIIEPDTQELSLDQVLSHITPDNRHDESDWSSVRGNEVW